jgi:hypothetical protein
MSRTKWCAKLFYLFLVLASVLLLTVVALPIAGIAEAEATGDIIIVVQDQEGNPIEGASADIFWDEPALNWMGAKSTDASGIAVFTAKEIASWRSSNGNPAQFQVWAKYETERSYGCVYTWTISDEMPGISYDATRDYVFTYNLVMFVKQVKGMVLPEVRDDGSIRADYVIAYDTSETSLIPKMGFFCSWDTGATNPPENPIVLHFDEGKYVLLDNYLDAEISPELDSLGTHFFRATGEASLFKDVERDSDTVIAIPALIKTPVMHEGLTDHEKNAVEDYYTVVAGSPRAFAVLSPPQAPMNWALLGGIIGAVIVAVVLLRYFLVR